MPLARVKAVPVSVVSPGSTSVFVKSKAPVVEIDKEPALVTGLAVTVRPPRSFKLKLPFVVNSPKFVIVLLLPKAMLLLVLPSNVPVLMIPVCVIAPVTGAIGEPRVTVPLAPVVRLPKATVEAL